MEQLMQTEKREVKFEEIEQYIGLYHQITGRIGSITAIVCTVSVLQIVKSDNPLTVTIALAAFGIVSAYREEKDMYAAMRRKDSFYKGIAYIGYDEEFFGIFHENGGLVRKPLGKYKLLEGAEMNAVNHFIYDKDREVTIFYRECSIE